MLITQPQTGCGRKEGRKDADRNQVSQTDWDQFREVVFRTVGCFP